MPGINLATLRRRVFSVLESDLARSSPFFDTQGVDEYISEGYRRIQGANGVGTSHFTQDFTKDVVFFDLPPDILGRSILPNGVRVKDAQGQLHFPFERTWDQIANNYDFDNLADRAVAFEWAFSEEGIGGSFAAGFVKGLDASAPNWRPKIMILGPSPTTVIDGITIHYVRHMPDLGRMSDQAAITADVTVNSRAITFSADLDDNTVLNGDDFGVVSENATEKLPVRWYRIIDRPAKNTATLAEDYGEPTNTVANFIAAEVNQVELQNGGVFGFAPAHYAISRLADIQGDSGLAQSHTASFNVILQAAKKLSFRTPQARGLDPAKRFSWMRGGR